MFFFARALFSCSIPHPKAHMNNRRFNRRPATLMLFLSATPVLANPGNGNGGGHGNNARLTQGNNATDIAEMPAKNGTP